MKRVVSCWILLASLSLQSGCGTDTPTGPDGPPPAGDIDVFDIFLRPRSIQRSVPAGGLPNPHLSVHYLTAFFKGGVEPPVFQWQLDSILGELGPKSDGLGTDEASVTLLNGGSTPLGFHDITVTATSGGKTSTLTRRIAAVENSWQKHMRAKFFNQQEPPPFLALYPIFSPFGATDEIIYVESPSLAAINMRRIDAFTALNGPEQAPRSVFVVPNGINPNQSLTAAEVTPDLSPQAMGQDQLLFSSQLDPDFALRCPNVLCSEKIPLRIWTVRRPAGIVENIANVLTADSSFVLGANPNKFYAYDYFQPRWDPTATGYPARIAYITNQPVDVDSMQEANIWLADLIDLDLDNRPDSLINHRPLTTTGGIDDFDWHPNGLSIYVGGSPTSILKLAVPSGIIEKEITFEIEDALLTNPSSVSVFQKPGGHTLIAFEGVSENLKHLYVYDEDDKTLTRVTPFPFPVEKTLFPSWHPQKMWLTYVSDYSVNAWSAQVDPTPLGNQNFERQRRTAFPSVWVLKLED